MSLTRLVYTSQPAKLLSPEELESLVEGAAESNAHRGITGLLVASGSCYLQILEGAELPVKTLFNSIQRDSRHQDVRVLLFRGAEERMFPRWGMNLVHADKFVLDQNAMDKALLRLRLNSGTGERDAMRILEEFRRQLDGRLSRTA